MEWLLLVEVHELNAINSIWKSWEVLHLSGRGELATRGNAISHPPLKEDGLQLYAGCIYGSGVGSWATSIDALLCFKGNTNEVLKGIKGNTKHFHGGKERMLMLTEYWKGFLDGTKQEIPIFLKKKRK